MSAIKEVMTVSFCLLSSANLFSFEKEKPNILVILTDDLGFGDLSINGGKDIRTPNIDELFQEGVQFLNFYSNSTVSSPTRASLLTGCYPDLVGVPGVIRTRVSNSWGYFSVGIPTMAEKLKEAGYHTALIGKWHLGLESPNLPNDRGFDYFKGFLGDMMDDYYTHLRRGKNYMRLNREVINPDGHATDIFTDWTIDYLKKAKQLDEPFFLYLAYNAPHFPIQPPDEWVQSVKEREPGLTELRAKNVALVEHLDAAIGRLLESLKKLGLSQNTIVVFSSDNGGSLPHGASNGLLRGGKQDMYEGGIKVPTCIVWPGVVKPGVTSCLAVTMDILPTLCEIAGVEIDTPVNGLSLFPTITGEENAVDDRVIFFMRREGGKYGGLCYYAARHGNYKLLQNNPFEPYQLFDIMHDPLEKETLNNNKIQYNKLKHAISQHILKSGFVPWQKGVAP